MNIDDRIQNIMKKMEKLSSKHPEDTCGEFPPKWGEPLTEQDVVRFEKEKGIALLLFVILNDANIFNLS